MTAEVYGQLLRELDGRFRELGMFCNDMPKEHLKSLLHGELLMVVLDRGNTIVWFPATKKELDRLFLATA